MNVYRFTLYKKTRVYSILEVERADLNKALQWAKRCTDWKQPDITKWEIECLGAASEVYASRR